MITLSENSDDPLVCPHCEGDGLHHGKVVVRNRRHEDSDGIRVAVDGQIVNVAPEATFAGRRDDVEIEFSCEGCHGTTTLRIYQHKGQTFIHWLPRAQSL